MMISQIHCSLFVNYALLFTCACLLLSSVKEDSAEQRAAAYKIMYSSTRIQPELGRVFYSGLVAAALLFSWEIT